MLDQFSRTALVIKQENIDMLATKRVAVFGVGGVGGNVVEALVRSGVGTIDIIDNDTICLTNLNRQLLALHSTIGRNKVDVCEERCKDINPNCVINKHQVFYLPENSAQFPFAEYDYVVDAIDTVSAKLDIALKCQSMSIPLISCMGTGNKLNPYDLKIADISKTSVCPLAKVMRVECRKRGIKKLKVLYSTETVIKQTSEEVAAYYQASNEASDNKAINRRSIPGSTAFIPPIAGLMLAREVIIDLINSNSSC